MTETITAADYKDLLKFEPTSQMKYRNKITIVDNIRFDSKREADYYGKLKILVKSGDIISFERQVRYKIIVNGELICTYVSDFDVLWRSGKKVVVDTKGISLPIFKIKAKLMKAIYGINIFIV